MVKLSIIIPYFETYELTCKILKQLSIQLNDEVEVILIDDGCNETRFDSYDYIKVIHKDNEGVAKTRNMGINVSKGQYIGFIDCDDMITNDYIETLLNGIKSGAEVINFNWLDVNENVVHIRPDNFAPWKAIYRRDIIPKFKENKKYGAEDVYFQAKIDKKEIVYLDRVLYFYNSNREGSLMWKKALDKAIQKERSKEKMIKCEAITDFSLKDFNKLKNMIRKHKDEEGKVYMGDVFECDEKMANYLMGDNEKKMVVVKILEVVPKEDIQKEISKAVKKAKNSKK